MSFDIERIAILGTGLIGGSLARAVAEHFSTVHIAAYDTDTASLTYGAEHGFLHSCHTQASSAAANADIVIFASPPSTLAALASEIAPALKKGAIVSDVTSIKRYAVNVITAALPDSVYFVPGHPIAGSEKSGIQASSSTLFAGKRIILTPEENALRHDSVRTISALWETIGAKVEYMPAELHDCIYAYISHLPQMVAFAMTPCLEHLALPRNEVFTSFIRLSQSSTALWSEIALANADFVSKALKDYITFVAQMEAELVQQKEFSEGVVDPLLCGLLFAQVVATCLIASASVIEDQIGVRPLRYAGRGFADMTAPASSDPEAALNAISAQAGPISLMLKKLLERLRRIDSALMSGDSVELLRAIAWL